MKQTPLNVDYSFKIKEAEYSTVCVKSTFESVTWSSSRIMRTWMEERREVMETDYFLFPQNRCKQLWRKNTNSNFDLEIKITLWTTDLIFT